MQVPLEITPLIVKLTHAIHGRPWPDHTSQVRHRALPNPGAVVVPGCCCTGCEPRCVVTCSHACGPSIHPSIFHACYSARSVLPLCCPCAVTVL